MALNSTQKVFALAAIKEIRAEYEDYLRDMDDLRKEGFGSSHCFHGTSRWTGYDNICGWCEGGLTLHDMALNRAKSRYKEVEKKLSAYLSASTVFGEELTAPLRTEVNNLISRYSAPRL